MYHNLSFLALLLHTVFILWIYDTKGNGEMESLFGSESEIKNIAGKVTTSGRSK